MKLSSKQKQIIMKAIENAEQQTSGEIRVHLSYSKNEENPLVHAQKQFEKLKMHLTKDRNGVLLYLNPRARKFALFGDAGIHEKLGQEYWNSLKDSLSMKIKEKDLVEGIVHAVHELGTQLKTHFPYSDNDRDELKNEISES